MATNDIDSYSAVVTPATTDDFVCQQSGTTKKITTADLLDVISIVPEADGSELSVSDIVMGTQSGGQVKITFAQIITYAKTITYGLAFGGSTGAASAVTEAYSISGDSWTSRTPMNTARQTLAGCTVLNKGYSFGGQNSAVCEEYSYSGNSWTAKASMDVARWGLSGFTLSDRGYATGGTTTGGQSDSCQEFYPAGNSWADKADISPTRTLHAGCAVGGKGYIYGGFAPDYTATCQEYNLTLNSWATKASMNIARASLAGFGVSGKAYSVAGWLLDTPEFFFYDDCEEYDPSTDIWTAKADLPITQYLHTGFAALSKGYVCGGIESGYEASTYEYNPSTKAWKAMDDLNTARSVLAATSLHSG